MNFGSNIFRWPKFILLKLGKIYLAYILKYKIGPEIRPNFYSIISGDPRFGPKKTWQPWKRPDPRPSPGGFILLCIYLLHICIQNKKICPYFRHFVNGNSHAPGRSLLQTGLVEMRPKQQEVKN